MCTEFDLLLIRTQWALGLIPADDLPNIAAEALSAGIESKSLITLAGLVGTATDEARRLFDQALNELNCEPIERSDALRQYARIISAWILDSKISAKDGAKRIWQATLASGLANFHDLDPFVYAVSELESRPKERAFFEKAILDEAARWKGGKERG